MLNTILSSMIQVLQAECNEIRVQEACEYIFPVKCMHDSVMLATLLRHAFKDNLQWLQGFEVSTKAELLLVICLRGHVKKDSSALEHSLEHSLSNGNGNCTDNEDSTNHNTQEKTFVCSADKSSKGFVEQGVKEISLPDI